MTTSVQIPDSFKSDAEAAVDYLKSIGCTEVYLFGSLVTGTYHEGSDLDIAVRGCPPNLFYHAAGELLMRLQHSVDLIDLDLDPAFASFLLELGELRRVA